MAEVDSLSFGTVAAVIDALPIAAFVIEDDSIYCNRGTELLTGYDRSHFPSLSSFLTTLFPRDAEKALSILRGGANSALPPFRELQLTCKNGRTVAVTLAGSGQKRLLATMQEIPIRELRAELDQAVASFRNLAEHSADGFLLVEESGRILDSNEAFRRRYGFSESELLAMSVSELETPETREQGGLLFQDSIRAGHGRYESRHATKEGRTFPAESRLICIPCHPSAVMFVQDITDMKRQEQRRVETEALLKALIESVPFDFFALDRDGRYTMLSTKSAELWGDAIGKTVEEFAAEAGLQSYLPRWVDNNRRALAGESIEQERVYEWQGEERVVREILGPIKDPQQRVVGTFGINLDITRQKSTENALSESNERYRRLSELTTDYVYCCVRKRGNPYRVQWLGGAIEEITGYSEAEVFENGCWGFLLHPDDRERVIDSRMALRIGDICSDEFRIICKSGEICWIRETCRCEAGEHPGEFCLYGASRDISASKDAELAINNIEEIFRLFLEYSPAYLIFKDENRKILRLSRNFETLLDRPLSELVGKTGADIFPPEVAERIRNEDLRVLKDGKPFTKEEEIAGRHYSSTKFAIPQKDKPSLVVDIKTEITARKEAEEKLCRLNDLLDRRVSERTEQLEAAMLEQESFSYSVSHDLRAPLRHINSFSAILLEDYSEALPAEARDYLLRICSATQRMGVLIDNLLRLSRVSRTVINRTPVNLSEVAHSISRTLQDVEPGRVVEFRIHEGILASCDKVLVWQLLENLIGNAWKYTAMVPSGRIEFGMSRSYKGEVFFVKDNGAGFNMEYKDRLFAPFQRLHGTEFEGNGIGLATAQRIVHRHGGTIWAEGAEGKGAGFYFTLPE